VTIEETIRAAIASKTPLGLRYSGDVGAIRTIHPQVLYVSSTGELCVDAFQVAGTSSSGGPLPDWRHFDLAKIRRVEVLDGSYAPAPGLNLGAPRYAGVLAHV
jgi:hypothetical protein